MFEESLQFFTVDLGQKFSEVIGIYTAVMKNHITYSHHTQFQLTAYPYIFDHMYPTFFIYMQAVHILHVIYTYVHTVGRVLNARV